MAFSGLLKSSELVEVPDSSGKDANIEWSVVPSAVTSRGERRLEAASYLSDGFGLRTAIENHERGWRPLGDVADVWQPSRLTGVVVAPGVGTPFLSAGQVFESEPSPRKWLSLAKTPDAPRRFVNRGDLLLSCSGSVGRALAAYDPHLGCIITHDLLRIDPGTGGDRGWIYAYMRTGSFRAMATGAQYGHMIKHLEPNHVAKLPLIEPDAETKARFETDFEELLTARSRAFHLLQEAYRLFSEAARVDTGHSATGPHWVTPVGSVRGGRRRLDATYSAPSAMEAIEGLRNSSAALEPLSVIAERIWWPGRFRRVFGSNGTQYVSAAELFDSNPHISKRIYAGLVPKRSDYFVKRGWLLVARSGQTYGLNGRVLLVDQSHEDYFVSEDLIRIIPRAGVIRPGYLMIALSHPQLGRPIVIRNAYGTSIPHLEPADLGAIDIARFSAKVEEQIADFAEEAAELRGRADELEDEMTLRAETIVTEFLHRSSRS